MYPSFNAFTHSFFAPLPLCPSSCPFPSSSHPISHIFLFYISLIHLPFACLFTLRSLLSLSFWPVPLFSASAYPSSFIFLHVFLLAPFYSLPYSSCPSFLSLLSLCLFGLYIYCPVLLCWIIRWCFCPTFLILSLWPISLFLICIPSFWWWFIIIWTPLSIFPYTWILSHPQVAFCFFSVSPQYHFLFLIFPLDFPS